MACPDITFVVGSTTTPAQRGGVANANVTNGTFGVTGSVILRCGTTHHAVTELLWTPAAVSFRVPQNLPECAQGFQAIFTFAGQNCPAPIAIAGGIVAQPVLILNPQPILAASEQRLDLIGLNFGSQPVARLPELDPFYVQQNTYSNPTAASFGTDMATIRGLQTAPHYRRNAVLMDMQLVAVNRDDPNAERASAPALVKLRLPTPQAGRVTALGRELYFGHIVSRPDLPRVGDTEWLGGPAPHGEVRLYASDPTGTLNSLLEHVARVIAAGANFIDPATEPGASLRRLRESGTLLPVSYWREEGVLAQLPAENTTGFVIIWRDDLPSEPQPIVRTPAFDCAKLTEFVAGAWRLAVNGSEFLLDINQPRVINIDAADAPLFEVRRIAGVSNPLTLLLDAVNSVSSIRFGFVPAAVGFPTDPQDFRPQIGALSFGETLLESPTLKTLLHPHLLSPNTGSTGLGFKDWDITLVADVTVPACGKVRLNLLRIRLHQAPLVVPTIAVFFEHINLTGDPLIVLDPGNSVLPPDTFADAAVNSDALGGLVATVAVTLDALALALSTLSVFSNVSGPTRRLPPLGHARVLSGVAAALRAPLLRPAVDARGTTINLRDVIRRRGDIFGFGRLSFQDELSSMLMIGLPNLVGIRAVQSSTFGGELSALFRVPAGTVIASTNDFRGVIFNGPLGGQSMRWRTNTTRAVEDLNGVVIIGGGQPYFNDLWDRLEFRRP